MERAERLLDLVAILLDAREPISWSELRESFPEDYGSGSDEATERKFERDKAELLELGIPLVYLQGDDDRKDGYLVDREAYYLPQVGLTPEELAVLYAAGSSALSTGAFPGQSDLSHALRKIGFLSGSSTTEPGTNVSFERPSDEFLLGKLEQTRLALHARKSLAIRYYSPNSSQLTERKVNPYGLVLRRGIWTLVGHCHLRNDIRAFHVQRIQQLEMNQSRPRSPDYEIPLGFILNDHVASHVWQHRFHPEIRGTVRLFGELRSLALRLFPDAIVTAQNDASTEVSLGITYLDGWIRYVLSLGPSARVTGPPEAVSWAKTLAEKVEALHE